MQSDSERSDSHNSDVRERLTAVYAAFNHAVVTRLDRLATHGDDAFWIDTDDEEWTRRVSTAVDDGAISVTAASVSTTTDGDRFDVPFELVHDVEKGGALEVAIAGESALENR